MSQSFCLSPVPQRLPSVVLLLNDILKHTDKRNEDHVSLDKAINSLKGTMNSINECKRKTEGHMAMFDVINDIDNVPPQLLSSHRQFLAKVSRRGGIRQELSHLFELNIVPFIAPSVVPFIAPSIVAFIVPSIVLLFCPLFHCSPYCLIVAFIVAFIVPSIVTFIIPSIVPAIVRLFHTLFRPSSINCSIHCSVHHSIVPSVVPLFHS